MSLAPSACMPWWRGFQTPWLHHNNDKLKHEYLQFPIVIIKLSLFVFLCHLQSQHCWCAGLRSWIESKQSKDNGKYDIVEYYKVNPGKSCISSNCINWSMSNALKIDFFKPFISAFYFLPYKNWIYFQAKYITTRQICQYYVNGNANVIGLVWLFQNLSK